MSEPQFDFNEAVNAKIEQALGAEPEPTEEAIPEPEEVESIAEIPQEEPERLYAGRYKTVEELEKAVEEKEAFIRSQTDEVGEGRKAKAQLELLQEQLAQTRTQPTFAPTPSSTIDGLLEQGRYQEAAQLTQQNPYLYQQVMEAWSVEAPFAAMDFHAQNREENLQRQITAQINPQVEAAARLVQQNELANALQVVANAHDDFGEIIGALDENRLSEIIQGGFPQQILEGLTGDLAAKQAVFETLYRWAKADQAGTINQAVQQAVTEQQQRAETAKMQATVASQTTGTSTEQPVKPVEEQIAEQLGSEWTELSSVRSLEKGWTGRESR